MKKNAMPVKKRKKGEPLPESFPSAEAAGDFWDTHDLGDYWDQTKPVTDLKFRIKRRQFLFAVEPSLARRLRETASGKGITGEALLNLWLSERLNAQS
jgi:hypothetical protein